MTTERVHFRLIQTPCCTTMLCYVNPRLPNFCSECGKYIFDEVKSCVLNSDENALLKYKFEERWYGRMDINRG
jgi:hypothetical protein